MQPTLGRVVLYTLTADDAKAINQRRVDFYEHTKRYSRALQPRVPGEVGYTGHIGHVGNYAEEDQVFAAEIVRVYPKDVAINLQVKLDGNDTLWVTSKAEGEGAGHWAWPPRV